MINLPQVTMVIIDTVNYGQAVNAIQKSLKEITPAKTLLFTDIEMDPTFIGSNVDIIKIRHIYNKSDYSKFMMKELGKYKIDTSHILVIQNDGWVTDGEMWTDEFLEYSYIGAVWPETDGYSVGNGGFSLRSWRLHQILAEDETILGINPEDVGIARIYRNYLEQKYEIKFAPEKLAHQFSYELHEPMGRHFGFHGKFHPPYVEPICIKRTAALGDVIQVEPVLEYFHNLGHPVYLDTLPGFYQLFGMHHYPVKNYAKFDKEVIKHRVIDLDLSYETKPQQLHLKSYFEMAGITDYKLRNPKLNYPAQSMFLSKYIVLHIDNRETTHRNIFGVQWTLVADHIKTLGYTLIQIGKNDHEKVGIEFNCITEAMMVWLIGHCGLFIGVDSGPAAIAVATGRKSVLFFGSVNPAYIHADLTNVEVLQSKCPVDLQNCWHFEPGTRGQDCVVNDVEPPCCVHTTTKTIQAIDKMLKK